MEGPSMPVAPAAKKQKTGPDATAKQSKQSSASKKQQPTADAGKQGLLASRAASAAHPTAAKQKLQSAAAGKEKLVRDRAAAAAQTSSAKQHHPRRSAAKVAQTEDMPAAMSQSANGVAHSAIADAQPTHSVQTRLLVPLTASAAARTDGQPVLQGKRRQQGNQQTAESSSPSPAGTTTQAKASRLSVQGLPNRQLSASAASKAGSVRPVTTGKANDMKRAAPSKGLVKAGTTPAPAKTLSRAARPSSKAGPSSPAKQAASARMPAPKSQPAAEAATTVLGKGLKAAAEGKSAAKISVKNALPAKRATSLKAANIKASQGDKAATAVGQAAAVALDSKLGCSKCRFAATGCGKCRAKQAGHLRAVTKSRGESMCFHCTLDCKR